MKIDILTASINTDAEPLVLELLDRIGRARALHDDESLLVEKILKRTSRRAPVCRVYRNWSPSEDGELWSRQFRRRAVAEYAVQLNISETAAWSRLRHLRNLRKGKRVANQVEG